MADLNTIKDTYIAMEVDWLDRLATQQRASESESQPRPEENEANDAASFGEGATTQRQKHRPAAVSG